MNYLKEKWWTAFKSDGVLFEKLCRKLLECMADSPIMRTKRTWDGGRDLEGKFPILRDDYCVIWGECKYHSQKLSLQKVSSTLVMAYLNDVDFLFFFSYSPVNSTFEHHITDFCDKAKIRHYTYDGVRLEALLLQYQDEPWFDEFFPRFPKHSNYVSPSGLEISSCLERNSKGQRGTYADQEFSLNETFRYQIYLTNQDVQNPCNVTISMEKGGKFKYVEVSEAPSPHKYIKKVQIPPSSTVLVCYKMRVIRYAPTIHLPVISITHAEQCSRLEEDIRVNWLAEIPLIGGDYATFLWLVEKQLIGRTDGTLLHIYGRSGCGKSRLLDEASYIYDKHQYTVIPFDCETQNVDIDFIARTIVSYVEHLPDCFESSSSTHSSQALKSYRDKMSYHILYDEQYVIYDHEEQVLRYLTLLLRQEKVIVSFDNIQVLQNSTLEFLQELIRKVFRQPSESSVLCCVNLDYLYPESLGERFHNQLLAWTAKHPQSCMGIECEDFNTYTAKLYLKRCVQPLAEQEQYLYDQTFCKIIDRIGTNPFALQQTLLLLRQKGIISLTRWGSFYFSDIKRFEETLGTLSKGIKGVLANRERELFSSLDPSAVKDCKAFLSLLVFFQTAPLTLCCRVIENAELIEELKRLGFIRIINDNQIAFYHNYFFLFFQNDERYRHIPAHLAQQILSGIRTLKMEKELFAPYFILCHQHENLTAELCQESAAYLLSHQIPDVFLSKYCEIILRTIQNNSFLATPKEELRLCQRLCDYISDSKGVKRGLIYYETLFTRLVHGYGSYRAFPEKFFNFIKRYADNLNQCYRSDDTIRILETAEGLIEEFELDREMEAYIRARIENRKSVPYKDIGQRETALECINRSIKLAQSIQSYSILISGYHDKGYLYYCSFDDHAQLCENWSRAFDLYSAHQTAGTTLKDKVSCYIHGLLVDIACGAEQAAGAKYAVLTQLLNHTGMKSYELKIRLALCLYFTAKHIYPSSFDQLLEEAKDQCVFYAYDREYYKCFYLGAIKARREGNFTQCVEQYGLTMQSILANCQDARIFSKYTVQLLDILVQLRLNGGDDLLKDYRKQFKRFLPPEEIWAVFDMGGAAFLEFYQKYVPQTPFRNTEEKLGYPAV